MPFRPSFCTTGSCSSFSDDGASQSLPLKGVLLISAYGVIDVEILDPKAYEEYKALASASAAAHGGSYLARGGHAEVLEGTRTPNRVVILEFDSVERVKQWLNSPQYRPAKMIRHKAARTSMIVVEGPSES